MEIKHLGALATLSEKKGNNNNQDYWTIAVGAQAGDPEISNIIYRAPGIVFGHMLNTNSTAGFTDWLRTNREHIVGMAQGMPDPIPPPQFEALERIIGQNLFTRVPPEQLLTTGAFRRGQFGALIAQATGEGRSPGQDYLGKVFRSFESSEFPLHIREQFLTHFVAGMAMSVAPYELLSDTDIHLIGPLITATDGYLNNLNYIDFDPLQSARQLSSQSPFISEKLPHAQDILRNHARKMLLFCSGLPDNLVGELERIRDMSVGRPYKGKLAEGVVQGLSQAVSINLTAARAKFWDLAKMFVSEDEIQRVIVSSNGKTEKDRMTREAFVTVRRAYSAKNHPQRNISPVATDTILNRVISSIQPPTITPSSTSQDTSIVARKEAAVVIYNPTTPKETAISARQILDGQRGHSLRPGYIDFLAKGYTVLDLLDEEARRNITLEENARLATISLADAHTVLDLDDAVRDQICKLLIDPSIPTTSLRDFIMKIVERKDFLTQVLRQRLLDYSHKTDADEEIIQRISSLLKEPDGDEIE